MGMSVRKPVPTNGCGAAFGRDCVAPHGIDLGDHSNLQAGIGLDHCYRCPDAGEPPADNQDVVALKIHVAPKCYAVTCSQRPDGARLSDERRHAFLAGATRSLPGPAA